MITENGEMTCNREKNRNRNAGFDEDKAVRTEESMESING